MMRLPIQATVWFQASYTGFDGLLVDIQPSAARKNVLHRHLPSSCAGGHRKVNQSAPRALAKARLQFGVRSDVQARLVNGLHAPRSIGLHPAQAEWILNRSRTHFHASWVSRSDMTHSLEICDLPGV